MGAHVARIGTWRELNHGYKVVAEFNQEKCTHCGLCFMADVDGTHPSNSMQPMTIEQYLMEPEGSQRPLEKSGSTQFTSGLGGGTVNVSPIIEEF
jgi:hypothetical protein